MDDGCCGPVLVLMLAVLQLVYILQQLYTLDDVLLLWDDGSRLSSGLLMVWILGAKWWSILGVVSGRFEPLIWGYLGLLVDQRGDSGGPFWVILAVFRPPYHTPTTRARVQ